MTTSGLVLDLNTRRLSDTAGRSVPVGRRCTGFLDRLALASGRVVSKEALLTFAYGDGGGMDGSVKVALCRVRRDLVLAGMEPLIRTCWGEGYALTAPLVIIRCDGAAGPLLIPAVHLPALKRVLKRAVIGNDVAIMAFIDWMDENGEATRL